jgi:hypothetical protein
MNLVLFRICLFILGGNYWIYGYSLLYFYFGSYLAYNIAILRFPFMDEIIENALEDDHHKKERNALDIASTPEFLLTLCTVLLAVLIAVLEAVRPDGVPLKDETFDTKEFSFWVYGLFSVLLVFTFFFAILVYRVFKRKRNGIDSKVYLFVTFKHFDLYWFFLLILYGFLCIISCILYWTSDDQRYLIVGLLAPISVALLLNAYLKFAQNDFNYLEDISKINKWIDIHNTKIDEVKDKIKEFKKKMSTKTDGNGSLTGLLSDADITELAKSKNEYKAKAKAAMGFPLQAKSVPKEEKEEPKEEVHDGDWDEDGDIEEGGDQDGIDEEDNEDNEGGDEKSKDNRNESQTNKPLFEKKRTFDKGNLFGKAATVIVHDNEIDHDGDHTGFVKAS